MSRTIWKYEVKVGGEATLYMPDGAHIVHVACQHGMESVQLWALVEPDAPTVPNTFVVTGTGHPAPDGFYIGTALAANGQLVWHLWEVPS